MWSKLCTIELYRLGRASTPLWEACQVSTASATLLNSERHIQDPERTGIVQSTEGADQSTLLTTQLGSGLSAGSSPFLLTTLPLLTWVTLQREEAVGHREQAQHGLRHRQQPGWGRVQRNYSRMRLAELGGRVRRVGNRRSLNNPRMLSDTRVSAGERSVPQIRSRTPGSREDASPTPLAPASGKSIACPALSRRSSRVAFPTSVRGHAWAG